MSGYEEDDAEIDEMMKPAEEGSHEPTDEVPSDDRSEPSPRSMEDAEAGAQSMEDAMSAALNKLGETYKSQDAINLYNKIRKDNLGEAVPRSSLTRWIGTTRTRCSLTKYVVQQSSSVHHPINLGSHARNWSLTPYNVALEF